MNMYNLESSSPKPKPVKVAESDKKVVSLEFKVNRLVEQVTMLQEKLDQLSKIVKKQNSDINNMLSRINQLK